MMKYGVIAPLALFLLISCSTNSTQTKLMNETLMSENETGQLTVQLTYGADALKIQYRFLNKTANKIYLFNKLYKDVTSDMYVTDRNLAYVLISKGEIQVRKAVIPVPENMDVATEIIPCATKVAPNGSFEETFKMALPLTPKSPYNHLSVTDKSTLKPVSFVLGYFVGNEKTDQYERQTMTSEGPSIRFNVFSFRLQTLLRVGPTVEQVAVYQQDE